MPQKKKLEEESIEKVKKLEEKPAQEEADTQKAELIKEDKKAKLEKLKEKAKELEKTLIETKAETKDIKQKVLAEEERIDTLIPIEDYLKSSIHLGTRVITPDMKEYVYKRRADGLAVFNTTLLDKKIREAADFLAQYAIEDIIIVCKREAGWKPVEMFSKITGIRAFAKKYPAGVLTNPNLSDFLETELVLICDPWIDKNALNDALKIKIPILAICDTNNYTRGITKILPGNNKSAKSLGMILYLLTKLYVEKRRLKTKISDISEWIDNWGNLEPPK